jgi:hypothetical protein
MSDRPPSHLDPIYSAWDGNAEAMAADIGELGVTVRQWRNRNNIPPLYWQKIIEAAALKGRLLEWRQFVPPACEEQDAA